jgi:hypothetical protein
MAGYGTGSGSGQGYGGYGSYGRFDPGRMFAQLSVQDPFYDPNSDSPDVLGGIRKTINQIWAFREYQQEKQRQQKQQEFVNKLREEQMRLNERREAAYEMNLNKPKPPTAQERFYNYVDSQKDWTEEEKRRTKITHQVPKREQLTPGGEDIALLNNADPKTLTQDDIARFNRQAWQQHITEANRNYRKAETDDTRTQANDTSFVAYNLKDINDRIDKLQRIISNPKKISEKIHPPLWEKANPKEREQMTEWVPNPQYHEYAFQIQAMQKAKDAMEQIQTEAASKGGRLTSEQRRVIQSLNTDGNYKKLFGKNFQEEDVNWFLEQGIGPKDANYLYAQWMKEGGPKVGPFMAYVQYLQTRLMQPQEK